LKAGSLDGELETREGQMGSGNGEPWGLQKGEDPVGGNGVLRLAASSLAPFEGIAGKLMGDT